MANHGARRNLTPTQCTQRRYDAEHEAAMRKWKSDCELLPIGMRPPAPVRKMATFDGHTLLDSQRRQAAENVVAAQRLAANYDSRGAQAGRLDAIPLRDWPQHAASHDAGLIHLRNQQGTAGHAGNPGAFERAVEDEIAASGLSAHEAAGVVLLRQPGLVDPYLAGNMAGDDGGAASNACADAAFRIADTIQRHDPSISRQNALSAAWHEVQKTDLYQRMRAEQQLA